MQNQLLLLVDVEHLGRSGDLVTVKPGFARNFLIPMQKAVVATKATLRLRERLVEERQKQAEEDRKSAEGIVEALPTLDLIAYAKVDDEGRLYGSVSVSDIVHLLEQKGLLVTKQQVTLAHPIKMVGEYTIHLKLKEGVQGSFTLKVCSDQPVSEASS